MADTTQFTIGTEASGSDGAVGTLIRVIVDPTVEEVTHLVIEPEHRPDLGRLVPLDLVDFNDSSGRISLRCTKEQFENLDPAEDTQIHPGDRRLPGLRPGPDRLHALLRPGGGGDPCRASSSATGPWRRRSSPPTPSRWARSRSAAASPCRPPTATSAMSRGSSSTPRSRHVTHVLLQEGHLWGKKEVAIPIGAVTSTRDGIQLKISKHEVQDLPPVDASHPEKKP